ncbi:MAG: hypothetical protein Q9212_004815 [Teloschistes hypoglaucus]
MSTLDQTYLEGVPDLVSLGKFHVWLAGCSTKEAHLKALKRLEDPVNWQAMKIFDRNSSVAREWLGGPLGWKLLAALLQLVYWEDVSPLPYVLKAIKQTERSASQIALVVDEPYGTRMSCMMKIVIQYDQMLIKLLHIWKNGVDEGRRRATETACDTWAERSVKTMKEAIDKERSIEKLDAGMELKRAPKTRWR